MSTDSQLQPQIEQIQTTQKVTQKTPNQLQSLSNPLNRISINQPIHQQIPSNKNPSPIDKFEHFISKKRSSPDQIAKMHHVERKLSKDQRQHENFFGLRFVQQKNIFSNTNLNKIRSDQQVDLIKEFMKHPITPRQQVQNMNEIFAKLKQLEKQKSKNNKNIEQLEIKYNRGWSKNQPNKVQQSIQSNTNDINDQIESDIANLQETPLLVNQLNTVFHTLNTNNNDLIGDPVSNQALTQSSRYRLFQLRKIGRAGFGKYARMQTSSTLQNRTSQLPYKYLGQDQQTIDALKKIRSLVRTRGHVGSKSGVLSKTGYDFFRNNGCQTERIQEEDMQIQFRHLKKYSVVLDQLSTEQVKQEQIYQHNSQHDKNQILSEPENQKVDKSTIQKLNLRKINQFVPFFAERDNVGNLLTDSKESTMKATSERYHLRSKKSVSEFRNSQVNIASFKNLSEQLQSLDLDSNNQNIDCQNKQDLVFMQKFKCRDVFDQEYFNSVIQRQEQTKELKGKLTDQIAHYKSKEPLMKRTIQQNLYQKDLKQSTIASTPTPSTLKQMSKTQTQPFRDSLQQSPEPSPSIHQKKIIRGESAIFSDMYQPNKKFLMTDRRVSKEKLESFKLQGGGENIETILQGTKIEEEYQDNNQFNDAQDINGVKSPSISPTKSHLNSPSKRFKDIKPRICTSRESSKQMKENFLRFLNQNPNLLQLQRVQSHNDNHQVDLANAENNKGIKSSDAQRLNLEYQNYKMQIEQNTRLRMFESEYQDSPNKTSKPQQTPCENFQEAHEQLQQQQQHYPEDVEDTIRRLGLKSSEYANQLIQRFSSTYSISNNNNVLQNSVKNQHLN